MEKARLIRVVRFRASHRYHRPEWSAAENRRIFGAQGGPHEHEWRLEVHVEGPVDPDTGWSVDLALLDQALAAVVDPLRGADLNQMVPAVADGSMMPSTENLSRWFYTAVAPLLPEPTRLVRVRLDESPDLGASYPD